MRWWRGDEEALMRPAWFGGAEHPSSLIAAWHHSSPVVTHQLVVLTDPLQKQSRAHAQAQTNFHALMSMVSPIFSGVRAAKRQCDHSALLVSGCVLAGMRG